MAVVLFSPNSSLLPTPKLPRLSAPPTPPLRRRSSFKLRTAYSSMEAQSEFAAFPHASPPVRSLMSDLVSLVEQCLGSQLQPCSLPSDVRSYRNEAGTASGSLFVRRGHQASKVDFILGSWLHCRLPTGAALNITSLSGYLDSSTDAPNFLFELIQSSPTSLVLILDLPPRLELVTHPEYLSTFYEDTKLDSWRQALEKVPEARPYFSSALYIRCVVSPTAIMLRIETEAGQVERMEEIVRDDVSPVVKVVLGIWLDQCVSAERVLGETERLALEKRDGITRRKTIEIDLGSNFPRLFGPEVAERVLAVLGEVFRKNQFEEKCVVPEGGSILSLDIFSSGDQRSSTTREHLQLRADQPCYRSRDSRTSKDNLQLTTCASGSIESVDRIRLITDLFLRCQSLNSRFMVVGVVSTN